MYKWVETLQTDPGLLLLALPSRPSLSMLGSGSWYSQLFLSGCGLEQMLFQEQLESLSQNEKVGGTAWTADVETTPHHLDLASSREAVSLIHFPQYLMHGSHLSQARSWSSRL